MEIKLLQKSKSKSPCQLSAQNFRYRDTQTYKMNTMKQSCTRCIIKSDLIQNLIGKKIHFYNGIPSNSSTCF